MRNKSRVTNENKKWQLFVVGLFVGMALMTFVFLIIRKQPIDTLSIKFANGKICMDIKTSTIEYDSILSKLFSTPFSESGTLGWLAKNELVFLSMIDI